MMNIDDVYDLLREQEEKLDRILELLKSEETNES